MDVTFESETVFGVSAAESLCGVDAVAGLEFAHTVAHGFYGAGGIGTRSVGQLRLDGVSAVAHVRVIRIYARCVDPHEDLAGLRLWRGDLFELEHFGTAELMDANGLHEASDCSCGRFIEFRSGRRRQRFQLFSRSDRQ